MTETRKTQLRILAAVHTFCTDPANKLRYTLAGDAARAIAAGQKPPRKGPVDVMLPRDDYEQFIRRFSAPGMKLRSLSNDPSWYLPYAAVTIPGASGSASVRVFPADYLADGYQDSTARANKVLFARAVLRNKLLRDSTNLHPLKRAGVCLANAFLLPFPPRTIAQWVDNSGRSVGRPGALLGANVVWGRSLREIFRMSALDNPSEVDFLGVKTLLASEAECFG